MYSKKKNLERIFEIQKWVYTLSLWHTVVHILIFGREVGCAFNSRFATFNKDNEFVSILRGFSCEMTAN